MDAPCIDSLLRSVKIKESVEVAFCIGLPDLCICVDCSRAREQMDDRDLVPGIKTAKRTAEATKDASTVTQAKKYLKLSLDKESNDRFSAPCPDGKMEEIAKGKRSINTQRNTAWAVRVFKDWVKEHNIKSPDETVPEDFLEQWFVDRVAPLNHWISRFLVEARNREGKPYPPSSLQSLLTGILRYMREKNPDTSAFIVIAVLLQDVYHCVNCEALLVLNSTWPGDAGKPGTVRNGTERNGTERNGTGSNVSSCTTNFAKYFGSWK